MRGPADIDPARPGSVPARRVVLGVGASRGCPPAELAELVDAALAEAGVTRADVAAVASADIKADEPAILQLAAALGVSARFLSADVLKAVTVPTPSAVVAAHVGTPSVSEAAALLVAAEDGAIEDRPAGALPATPRADGAAAAVPDPTRARLLVTKRRSARATCAIAAPAGDAPPRRIVTATDDCRGCGGCVRTCPEHALIPVGASRADGTFATAGAAIPLLTLADRCTGCGECLEICPVDAFIEVLLP
ncbi:cobalamin biosynthesis protein [Patulibacter americanus]|uniref:cobalamin biosynthesis protein n=1 Tax=Patulibacter americanus TaxID=588672 RepID=UPI0003B728D2|nr:cobalamin biosynthesis protein [Patulibacter americanus]